MGQAPYPAQQQAATLARMGIYDRDYMRERARDARRAESKKRPAARQTSTIPTKPATAKRASTSTAAMAMLWLGVLLLLWAGFSLIR